MTIPMKTPTTDARISTRLAELTTQRAAIPDAVADESRASEAREIDARIHAIRTTTEALASMPLEPETKWLGHLTAWRDTLSTELLALPRIIRDKPRLDLQANITFSLKLIDFGLSAGGGHLGPVVDLSSLRIGELMAAAGYATSGPDLYSPNGWRGSMPEVEKRIKQLTKQRAEVQAQLDEVLITDGERATREVEHAAYRATLNAMIIRGNSEGTGLVVVDDDGDIRELTEPERAAFDWFEAKAFPR